MKTTKERIREAARALDGDAMIYAFNGTSPDKVNDEVRHAIEIIKLFGYCTPRRIEGDKKVEVFNNKLIGYFKSKSMTWAETEFTAHREEDARASECYKSVLSELDKVNTGVSDEVIVWRCIDLIYDKLSSETSRVKSRLDSSKGKDEVLDLEGFLSSKPSGSNATLDGTISELVSCLTSVLKMMSMRSNWICKSTENLVMPDRPDMGSAPGNQENARITIELSNTWRIIEREDSWRRFSNGNIQKMKDGYLFSSDEKFKYLDAASDWRFSRLEKETLLKMSGNKACGNEIEYAKNVATKVLSGIYAVDVNKHCAKFVGLTLQEWILGYHLLAVIESKKNTNGAIIGGLCVLDRKELVDFFTQGGMSHGASNDFLEIITFSRNSDDLYDCPLVRLRGGKYLFVSFCCCGRSISRIIFSRMATLKADFSDKGNFFETQVRDALLKIGFDAVHIDTKFQGVSFEVDCVFRWGDVMYVIECKNRGLPMGHPESLHWFLSQQKQACRQATKKLEVIRDNFSHFAERFKVKNPPSRYVPIVLNSLPFSIPGKEDGVFVVDYSFFLSFFIRPSVNFNISGPMPTKKLGTSYFMWEFSDKPSCIDFEREMDAPVQTMVALNHFRSIDRCVGAGVKIYCKMIESRSCSAISEHRFLENLSKGRGIKHVYVEKVTTPPKTQGGRLVIKNGSAKIYPFQKRKGK